MYIQQQYFFCDNQIIFNNSLIEKQIQLVKAQYNNITFQMFVYKKNDGVSRFITYFHVWELTETNSFISALIYYSKKKNINKNRIYILDIGANIGWFSLILGKFGYNIISFEPSKINYYILLKNFCLNKENKMTIINKGLDNTQKNSALYHPLDNIGNALIVPDNSNKSNYKKEIIQLSVLKNYITYLKIKPLALIKLDIEGSEAKALEGGIDLIIKYHIPFIFMEWSPILLRLRGTEPYLFLKNLEKNGYKISKRDFLSKQYCSIEEILNVKPINIFIIYTKFLE